VVPGKKIAFFLGTEPTASSAAPPISNPVTPTHDNSPQPAIPKGNKSSYILYVNWNGERFKLLDLIKSETTLIELSMVNDSVYSVRTKNDLSHWVTSKKFPCSSSLYKGICIVNRKIKLQKTLPEGVVNIKRWQNSDITEITFFNGFWFADALQNRLFLNNRYREIRCLISGNTASINQAEQNMRKHILTTFGDYITHIPQTSTSPTMKSNSTFVHSKTSYKDKLISPSPDSPPNNYDLLLQKILTIEKRLCNMDSVIEEKFNLLLSQVNSRFQNIDSKLDHFSTMFNTNMNEDDILTDAQLKNALTCLQSRLIKIESTLETLSHTSSEICLSLIDSNISSLNSSMFNIGSCLEAIVQKLPFNHTASEPTPLSTTFGQDCDSDEAAVSIPQNASTPHPNIYHDEHDTPVMQSIDSSFNQLHQRVSIVSNTPSEPTPCANTTDPITSNTSISPTHQFNIQDLQFLSAAHFKTENKTNQMITFIWNEFLMKDEITHQQRFQFEHLVSQFSTKTNATSITNILNGIKKFFMDFTSTEIPLEILYLLLDRLSSLKSNWQSALVRRKDSVADQIESCHSTSLSNSQPFTADQDGPYNDLRENSVLNFKLPLRSRHSTSLHNSQPFTVDEDGPNNSPESYKCALCTGKWTSHVTLFKHLFNVHWNSLHTLPQSYWDNLKDRTKLTICHPCKKTWSSKKTHCRNCKNPLGIENCLLRSLHNEANPNDAREQVQHVTNHSYFSNFQWPKLLEITTSHIFHLRSDIDSQIVPLLSEALQTSLEYALNSEFSELSMKLLHIFPICTLRKPLRGRRRRNRRSLTEYSKDLLNRWINGDYQSLFSECLDEFQNAPPYREFSNNSSNSPVQNFKRAYQLLQKSRISDAVKALSSRGFDNSNEVFEILVDKHPQRSNDVPDDLLLHMASNLVSTPIILTPESVLHNISTFSDGSSAGPSGLSPLLLKRCCRTPSNPLFGEKCLNSLTKFLQKIIDGTCPPEVTPFFFGASLIALKKKDGGTRPIAIGETLRRLAAKIVLTHLEFPFSPFQYGIKTKQGSEIIIHELRRIVESSITDPDSWKDKAILKIDLKNAFNNISRRAFIKIVDYCLPSLSAFISSCYGNDSELIFSNGNFIHSSEGVQQGDPLGPALFSLVLQSLILKIDSDCSLDLQKWFLDDGGLVGTVLELKQTLEIISSFGAGINLNLEKCEIFPLHDSLDLSLLPTEIQRVSSLDILGSPITDVVAFSKKRLLKVNAVMEDLLNLNHMQSAFILFKNCFGPCKINHLLRTVPPSNDFLTFLNEWDDAHSTILSTLLRHPLSPKSLSQAALPVKYGGLGLRSAHTLSPCAFLGSLVSFLSSLTPPDNELTQVELNALSIFNTTHNTDLTLQSLLSSLCSSEGHLQKTLSSTVFDYRYTNLFSSFSVDDKTWISNCKQDSASWFSSPPLTSKGIWLSNSAFQLAILTRIRESIFAGTGICTMGEAGNRSFLIDSKGQHSLGCAKGSGTHERHRLVRDAIFLYSKETGLQTRLEPLHVLSDSGNRPADIFFPTWMNAARPAALDVSVVVPTRHTPSPSAEDDYLASLNAACDAKVEKHNAACIRAGITFIPLIFSAAGSIHPKSMQALKFIADARSLRFNIPVHQGRSELMQRISAAIHRGNAVCLLSHGAFSIGSRH
jgi:hypothetical protein